MTRLSNSLMNEIKKEKLDIPFKVVYCLVRTRTFIRLNYLNKIICSSAIVEKKNENSKKKKKLFKTNKLYYRIKQMLFT